MKNYKERKYMTYKGYKIRVRCIDWEQVHTIDQFWLTITSFVKHEDVVGLGMNWSHDNLYFDYALGVINDDSTLQELKSIDFSNTNFNTEYIEIELPNWNEWSTFRGKDKDVKEIYENSIDCNNKLYDYELEYIDGQGNIEIKIHFIED